MKRRTVMKGALLAATSYAALPAFAISRSDGKAQIYSGAGHFIYDQRYRESAELAQSAAREGIITYAISDDLTEVWTKHLSALWRTQLASRQVTPIAGVTSQDALFMLEQLAWSSTHKLRVAFQSEQPSLGTTPDKVNVLNDDLVSWVLAPSNV